MNSLAELLRSLSWLRAIALALITIGAAGCSADSTRFGGQGEVTGSTPSGQAAPVGHVETRPLAQTASAGPESTGSVVAPASVVRKPTSSGQWSWDGGTAITVAPGETVDGIARRHGVPVAVIREANNLASPHA